MSGEGNVTEAVPETPAGTPARTPVVRWSVVRGQYFETMGIALLRGRYFADSDAANAPLVAIVDDAAGASAGGSVAKRRSGSASASAAAPAPRSARSSASSAA